MELCASLLVERVIHRALREQADFVLDDNAPLVAATSILLKNDPSRVHTARFQTALLRIFHESGMYLNDFEELKSKYSLAALIESRLLAQKKLSKELAVLSALQWLKKQPSLPEFLCELGDFRLKNIVNLSDAQFQIVLRLVELSLPMTIPLPFDDKERGLLLPIQKILSRLEAISNSRVTIALQKVETSAALESFYNCLWNEGDVDTFSDNVNVIESATFGDQINYITDQVKTLRNLSQEPVSIAVAFRTFDSRLRGFEEAFRKQKLPYNINGKFPLSELPDAKRAFRQLQEQIESEESPQERTISSHLDLLEQDSKDQNLKAIYRLFSSRLGGEAEPIGLRSFFNWVSSLLHIREVGFLSERVADVTEFVSVKQMGSRKYDYVFLIDLAHGRFPKTEFDSALMDFERHEINRLVKAPVLPVLYNDPLQSSGLPARFGYESFWFVNTIASAQRRLYLSMSKLDPTGREQAPSEFFAAAARLVKPKIVENLAKRPRRQREQLLKTSHTIAFDPVRSNESFGPWLGTTSSRPLTPSRLEAFANCSFRALFEKILGVEEKDRYLDDVDPKTIGKFVHLVLEKFFRTLKKEVISSRTFSGAERSRLLQIIAMQKDVLNEGHTTSTAIAEGQLMWLSLILERTISNILRNPPVEGLYPAYFEYPLGFEPETSKVLLFGRQIFIGGIIDRIDQGANGIAVVDYKLSSALSLRKKSGERELFKSHFQLPLYARLVLEKLAKNEVSNIFAYFVSVRDGVVTSVLGQESVSNFKELIGDDNAENGLVRGIEAVMQPIFSGKFEAKKNPTCDYCHLKSICRIQNDSVAEESCDE